MKWTNHPSLVGHENTFFALSYNLCFNYITWKENLTNKKKL